MKRFNAIAICSLLALGMFWFTSCAPTEWGETYIMGDGYRVYFQMPKPFKETDGWVKFHKDGRSSFERGFSTQGDDEGKFQGSGFEHGYVSEGDDEHKFQVRKMENNTAAWDRIGFNRRDILELGLNRDKESSSETILDRQEFIDPLWPDTVSPSEELTIESADGKTIRHTRVITFTYRGHSQCFVLFTASRPKGKPRSPDVDKFFNSFRICSTTEEGPHSCW